MLFRLPRGPIDTVDFRSVMTKVSKYDRLRYTTAGFCLLGWFLMLYSAYLYYAQGGSSSCGIGTETCDVVSASIYADVLGIPLSVLGTVYFIAVFALLIYMPMKQVFRWVLLASVFSLAFGVYLTGVSIFFLGTICIRCEGSKLVMVAIIALSSVGVRWGQERLDKIWVVGAVAVGAVFSLVVYLLQSGTLVI